MPRAGPKKHGPKPPKVSKSAALPATNQIPKSFVQAPEKFAPFLDSLPKDGFYLTHIDRTSKEEKRQLFMGPALLNLGFTILLAARVYYAVPQYISLLSVFLGFDSEARVDTEKIPAFDLASLLLRRSGILIFDYALYTLLGKWIVRFITEETSWRWSIGFRPEEIVVRVSKRWHKGLSVKWSPEDERQIGEKVSSAFSFARLQKSALQLVDASFVLETNAMVLATDLVDEGKLDLSDFDRAVFFHYPLAGGWILWCLAEPPSISKDQDDNLSRLRKNLTSKGKEDLFYRYVEIVQYEASRPGDFAVGYQRRAWEEAKKAFASQGVDLNEVKKEMGGGKSMPFFEDTLGHDL
ncbi:hypothetical protein UCRPC4_g01443 [Phaeomoniella chlamydospora]|uniref:Uncharacterized protein n=1 Tax=Phaeomoniella chlamydospora TaxID=158046 RepID=A0A0G2EVN8_PHACM|nr:hypothetical protein UCRPC4_g01443 [Phaeomoniella chlamydospora]